MKKKQLFIAWTKYQRRNVSMQDFFGYKLIFVSNFFDCRCLKPLDYLLKSAVSIFHLLRFRPDAVWTQLPPTVLVDIVLTYRKIFKRDAVLIADCHNVCFRKKWSKYLNVNNINRYDIILVHNDDVLKAALQQGVAVSKTYILEDRPAVAKPELTAALFPQNARPMVVMPCSFADDEPIDTVFEAARIIPETDIYISGNHQRASSRFNLALKPENVHLTGYLSLSEYEKLLLLSDLVLGLTTEPDVQLSVANEAVGFEKPMALSDTPTLRRMFHRGAVFVETGNPRSIAEGITTALNKRDSLLDEVRTLKTERNSRWEKMAEIIINKI